MRIIFSLECTSCKNRNYTTMKNKRNNPSRMNLKKYCPHCKSHTDHKETKK
ncbi:50S ribosomal protein L33 [Candidatus Riflebacteria bacterium]